MTSLTTEEMSASFSIQKTTILESILIHSMIPLDIPSLTTIQLTREAAFQNKDNIHYHSNPFLSFLTSRHQPRT